MSKSCLENNSDQTTAVCVHPVKLLLSVKHSYERYFATGWYPSVWMCVATCRSCWFMHEDLSMTPVWMRLTENKHAVTTQCAKCLSSSLFSSAHSFYSNAAALKDKVWCMTASVLVDNVWISGSQRSDRRVETLEEPRTHSQRLYIQNWKLSISKKSQQHFLF